MSVVDDVASVMEDSRVFGEGSRVQAELYAPLRDGHVRLVDLIWEQHRYHEARRWSVETFVRRIQLEGLSDSERTFVQNAGLAELTTKPGADRLTRLADRECRKWIGRNDALASAMQACSTWSRYWNEEESHHETAFNYLTGVLKLTVPSDDVVIEFRKIFPDDDMLRTLTLLAMSEIAAAVQYGQFATRCEDQGLRELLKQVSADEIQHMQYFTSFAKALVDSGEYEPRGAFAVVHLFVKKNGEFESSSRPHRESRATHVNWWDAVVTTEEVTLETGLQKKRQMASKVLERITGISAKTPEAIEQTWLAMVGD